MADPITMHPVMNPVVIGQYTVNQHPKEEGGVVHYADTANGAFRVMQLVDKIFSWLNTFFANPVCEKIGARAREAWTFTAVPRLPGATQTGLAAFRSMYCGFDGDRSEVNPEVKTRRQMKAFSDITDMTVTWGCASPLFLTLFEKTKDLGNSIFKWAGAINFLRDVDEGIMSFQDVMRMNEMQAKYSEANDLSPEVQGLLRDTSNYYSLKTLKSVCSVAGFVFGMVALFYGVVPGAAIAAATISLVSTLLGMGADLYKETMSFEPVKPFDSGHVVWSLTS